MTESADAGASGQRLGETDVEVAVGDLSAERAVQPEMLWAVVTQLWDDDEVLVVLPREAFEHWHPRVEALECSTWGELRREVPREVYEEICDLCGYGTFEAYTQHLDITGMVPLPGAHQMAAERYDPDATPPADDEPFRPDNIGAYADGDWPPAAAFLMYETLPDDILDEYAETWMTVFNGAYAKISVEHRRAVLDDLAALGYALTEEPRLHDLVSWQ
ncbi:MAG: hypothetical protein ACK2UL_02040 [Anaerolineae bacterium]